MSLEDKYSVVPTTGVFGEGWPSSHNLTQGASGSLSTAGWTVDNIDAKAFGNEGFIQQTFLGASILSFDLSAGFGDTTSTLSAQLINDEYNISDGLSLGDGDDPYHDGAKDEFKPPVVGSPVYFKFGKNFASIEQAFRQTFDNLYKIQTLPPKVNTSNAWGHNFPTQPYNELDFPVLPQYHVVDLQKKIIQDRSELWDEKSKWRGRNHFAFGGILQSYTQNKGPNGVSFNVAINDPREILSNVEVLFNNYQGTTFNYKNLINVYGFLEYDPPSNFYNVINSQAAVVDKFIYPDGTFEYVGLSAFRSPTDSWNFTHPRRIIPGLFDEYKLPNGLSYPITGQGFSRRGEKGIPWYRVKQALNALFEYFGPLPQEYKAAGFGGRINFRGYNYVVDFSGIPTEKISLLYYLDFDKLDLLSLAQELCQILSHELYVTLLPVIDHPACKYLYEFNQQEILSGRQENIIAGIIRLDAIDKTSQPAYGAIKSYIDNLESRGIVVENQDVGFELSNVTTDKFVVGGQEVDMYLFSTERDRDELWKRESNVNNIKLLQQIQWELPTQEQQQVIPYYGKLSDGAISIPRGFGAYQQILLETKDLNAFGVGNYYVATELELRAAAVSYESWKDFLLSYNDIYLEDISDHSLSLDALSAQDLSGRLAKSLEPAINVLEAINDGESIKLAEYLTSIPGRKFAVTVPRCVWDSDKPYLVDGYPASPCSPPFGYPLYYGRATRIGIPEAGMAKLSSMKGRVISDIELLRRQESGLRNIQTLGNIGLRTDKIRQAMRNAGIITGELMSDPNKRFIYNIENAAKRHLQNAKKVYEFLKKTADECLGRKFLVKIPKKTNLNFRDKISTFDPRKPFNIKSGPFGFPPRAINGQINLPLFPPVDFNSKLYNDYLSFNFNAGDTTGALKGNYNPFSENWEWNYKPEPQGGFFGLPLIGGNSMVVKDGLFPVDSQKLTTNSNRISCYVKYNNSHLIDFTGVGSENIAQQTINQNGQFVPDISELLQNNNLSAEASFDMIQQVSNGQSVADIRPNSVAFVKCEVSEEFYMPPRLQSKSIKVWGSDVEFIFSKPREQTFKSLSGKCVKEETFYERSSVLFRPSAKPGDWTTWIDFARVWDNNLKSWIIDTSKKNLDSENVYALITLPGRLKSTVDVRWKDGPGQAYQTVQKKHLMCQDVVYIPQFAEPALPGGDRNFKLRIGKPPLFNTPKLALEAAEEYGIGGYHRVKTPVKNADNVYVKDEFGNIKFFTKFAPGQETDWNLLSLEQIASARNLEKQIRQSSSLNDQNSVLSITSPSPLFPDFVAIPMMSKERCYGPWLSTSQLDSSQDARIRYSNIGGRVEFVKDENLTPWSYLGYQLMNEAGSLQAQFSNSLLLFSERGGFVIPDAPTGIALASALSQGGPLITSISVSVDLSNMVKTTIKLDLYTSKFGKLQKQKEIAISQITRERQKILDMLNNSTRRGLGKSQTNVDLVSMVMANGGEAFARLAASLSAQISANVEIGAEARDIIINAKSSNTSVMSDAYFNKLISNLDTDVLRTELSNGSTQSLGSLFTQVAPGQNFLTNPPASPTN
jgi:hypothetical protein